MDYEKRYKEALEWMQGMYGGLHGKTKEEAEKYFPELKESDDERIGKSLIKILKKIVIDTNYKELDIDYNIKDMIAWLEKHGESDETRAKMFLINKGYPIDTNGIFPTYEEMYNIIREGLEKQDKQKLIFNADDWYVSKVDGKIHNAKFIEKQGEKKVY